MRITDLDEIHDTYDHIYLSPHLDDAVLSCGGAIAGHRQAGERVLVVTLCTAAPDPAGPFNEVAQEFHRFWALSPEQVVAARLREEVEAMQRTGADYYWAGMLDAIYRCPRAYYSRATLFGTPAPDDPLLPALRQFIGALHQRLPSATLYAPLAIGNHVDHQITYTAALDSLRGKIAFYEDFPYVARTGALDRRMAAIKQRFNSCVIDIHTTLSQKISAISAYASQLDELFGGSDAMTQSVANYARNVRSNGSTHAERLWVRDQR